MSEYRMSVPEARRSDPREYGYALALADHKVSHFQQMCQDEPDLIRAELMAEGWNEFQEENEIEDRMVTAR